MGHNEAIDVHVVSIFFFCVLTQSSTAQDVIRVVSPGIPPITIKKDGNVSGIGADLTKEVFKRLGRPIEILVVPGSRALHMIQQGQADAIFAVARTPDREAYMYYTDFPIVDQPIALYVHADSQIVFNGNLKTLVPYSIGVIRGARLSPDFEEALKKKMFPKLNEVTKYKQNILLLDAKRIDITIGPRISIMFAAKELGKQEILKELNLPLTPSSPAFLAVAKNGKAANLMSQLDRALKAIKRDGTYDRIMQHYLQ